MGKKERLFGIEDKIFEYKDTNDEALFEQIIGDKNVKTYVTYTCHQKLKNSPTTLYSLDDLMNIAFLVLWQSIHKYRFICAHCKKQAKTHTAFKLHMVTKHEQYEEPAVSITRYLKFNLGAYLQNHIRAEYSQERRSNVMTISIYSPIEENNSEEHSKTSNDNIEFHQTMVSDELIENEFVFKDSIKGIVSNFDNFTKEVFSYLYEDRMKQIEIAELLFKAGRYSSEQSAAVVVSRIVKNKINPALMTLYPELSKK
jgi:hypothetical protein